MAISRERFDMAMDRLTGADWEQFEHLASAFLASEYLTLRTMASPSGDGGRDSELFTSDDEPNTAMQYSVDKDWSSKIRQTVERLTSTFPAVSQVVYLTNQVVGAKGDSLHTELRRAGKFLDIRDRSWFLDRANLDQNRESAAEALARKFVDPLLSSRGLNQSLVTGLEGEDQRIALLFLEMQVQDTDRSLGLTKASYDTLTLAALRDTNTSNRLKRDAIYARVKSFLPTHPDTQIHMRLDASLKRLAQKAIRHRKDQDEFHLLDSEIMRVSNSVARIDLLRRNFEEDLANVLAATTGLTIVNQQAFVHTARRVIEVYFLRKGEDFAKAAAKAESHRVDDITLKSVAIAIVKNDIGVKGRPQIDIMLSIINTLFSTASEATSDYLRLLLESYTLFAFLAATPDVQKATRGMFGSGEIWLDTSVLLPVLAETAMQEDKRPFTEMFKQARMAGLKLYVTQGVLEEVERHINRSKAYSRSANWNGDVPFLYSSYAMSCGAQEGFPQWLESFIGEQDPMEDIADYFSRYHHIIIESATEHDDVPEPLAVEIVRIWQEIHLKRRGQGDTHQTLRLAAHDAETYLHVLSSRIKQRGKSPLGYTHWWLTLDTKARGIMDNVDVSLRPPISIGPVLSIDYLLRYLAFGPSRDKVDVTGAALAKVYADVLIEPIPRELMTLVTELRAQHANLPEIVVQRRIRDTLNHERSRLGTIDSGGLINPVDLLDAAY